MIYLLAMLYGVWWGFLRRWFGGCLGNYPLLKNRGIQTAVMILSMLLVMCKFESWQDAFICVSLSLYLQFQFWSRGHGACFDIGRGKPEESTIKRYNERWYHKPIDWLFKINGADEYKYGFLYDFLYMTMRYSCPMIILGFISKWFLFIGLIVSCVYAFNWTLYEKENWIFNKLPSFCKIPTQLSEIIVGFVFGFVLFYIFRIAN